MDEPIALAHGLNLEVMATANQALEDKLTPADPSTQPMHHSPKQKREILPWPPRVRKGIRLMAMGTVPCLLWKWWTWWVVLREEETRAATAGQGNTSSARESTSRNRKAGLAHTTGDATAGLGASSVPSSTSTSTSGSMGAGNRRPLPLRRHRQERCFPGRDADETRPLVLSMGLRHGVLMPPPPPPMLPLLLPPLL
ncbi:hypothetical protein EYF80_031906 [Liparis tanakae]|uniref:Uncharacterized protein n=1 Tax=Liparis tanakae TaxID=230148 RepID=A0A4Z2GW79_9TELE|nr:hypothetical protein EYF80_031906 [Liparis tanakae]